MSDIYERIAAKVAFASVALFIAFMTLTGPARSSVADFEPDLTIQQEIIELSSAFGALLSCGTFFPEMDNIIIERAKGTKDKLDEVLAQLTNESVEAKSWVIKVFGIGFDIALNSRSRLVLDSTFEAGFTTIAVDTIESCMTTLSWLENSKNGQLLSKKNFGILLGVKS